MNRLSIRGMGGQRTAGFTIIELMVTIVVVALLVSMAVPIMRGHAKRAIATEGKAVAGAIRTAQRVWFAEHEEYTATWSNLSGQVDLGNNKYFGSAPKLVASGSGSSAAFSATLSGAGDASGLTVSIDEAGELTTSGL